MEIHWTIDDGQIRRMLQAGDREVTRGVVTAMNKAGKSIRAQSIKGTSATLRITSPIVRKRFWLNRANKNKLRVLVRCYAKPMRGTLGKHGRQNKTGVTAFGRQFAHGFLQRGKGGTQLVFMREPPVGGPRYPIIPQEIEVYDVAEPIITKVAERRANDLFNRELPWAVGRAMDRAARS